jgi:hypothetical protein
MDVKNLGEMRLLRPRHNAFEDENPPPWGYRLPGIRKDLYAIQVLPTPVPIPPSDIRMFWHERYHNDPTVRWLRHTFVELFQPERRRNK